MNISKLLLSLNDKNYLVIDENQLGELVSKSVVVIEQDTLISDKIRLLKINNEFIMQEKSNKDELLIRSIKSLEEGEELIKKRMEIYDKMWDGCGCKIDYYNQFTIELKLIPSYNISSESRKPHSRD